MSIPRTPLTCTRCQAVLQGELDTFGAPGEEICYECWSEDIDADDTFGHYGMAPHHHDFSLTGHWIGSTVLDPLPAPDEVDAEVNDRDQTAPTREFEAR